MIDVLIVGAGLTSAIIAATLRRKQVLVIDTAPYLGGLLHDLCVRDTFIPQAGTWFLDSKNTEALGILDPHMRFSRVLHNPPGVEALFPQGGWTAAVRHLFGGAEVILGATPDRWISLLKQSKHVVYTGRLDLLPWPTLESHLLVGSQPYNPHEGWWLPWYGIRSQQTLANHLQEPVETHGDETTYFHRKLTGGNSDLATQELHINSLLVQRLDPSPAGPEETSAATRKANLLQAMVERQYPQITLAGHLGTFQDLDLGQTVRLAHRLAKAL